VTSSAPKRRNDKPAAPARRGKRVAHRRGLLRLLPSPAAVGAVVLVAAGIGAVGIPPDAGSGMIEASAQTLDGTYAGTDAGTVSATTVSRTFDRQRTQRQVAAQAEQLQRALEAESTQVEKRANQLKKNEKKKQREKKRKERQSKQWVLPVTGYHLSARFGESSGLWSSNHTGLDFAGPSGSKIVSVAAGTVKETGSSGAYGNRTIITLNDGTEIWYAHQSSIEVSPGQKVAPGDLIGYTGSTGNVTGPHLHLEVRPDGGDPVDPYDALVSHNVDP